MDEIRNQPATVVDSEQNYSGYSSSSRKSPEDCCNTILKFLKPRYRAYRG